MNIGTKCLCRRTIKISLRTALHCHSYAAAASAASAAAADADDDDLFHHWLSLFLSSFVSWGGLRDCMQGKTPQPMPRVHAHIKPCRCPLARHRAVDWTMRTSTHRHLALWEGQQNICPISATRLAVRRAAHVMANAKQTSAASGNHGREAGYSYHVAQILKVIVPDDLRPEQLGSGGGGVTERQHAQASEAGCRHPVRRLQGRGGPSCL